MKETKILLIGDSISMGYRGFVKQNLAKSCRVLFPDENACFAAYTYRKLYEWKKELGLDAQVDLVYWNNGLWDVVRIFGEEEQTPINIYIQYLDRILNRLKKMFPKAVICFATTTPIKEEMYDRDFFRANLTIEKYNQKAKEVLNGKVDYIDDLYAIVEEKGDLGYIDATHFDESSFLFLAEHITKQIGQMLDSKLGEGREYIIQEIANEKKLVDSIVKGTINEIAIWGAGNVLAENIGIIKRYCDVKYIIDSNKKLQGTKIYDVNCISPEKLTDTNLPVVITIQNKNIQRDVAANCNDYKVQHCSYNSLIPGLLKNREREIFDSLPGDYFLDYAPDNQSEMVKYIALDIPVTKCNLKCSYCYLGQNNHISQDAFMDNRIDPLFLRYCLRRDEIGGSALIGMCGDGETLLYDNFSEICLQILKEGHYLHIVTNGIFTERIREIIEKSGEYAQHIIFKLSFHYSELVKRNLLGKFVSTVNMIHSSLASYTIELMPHDEIIPYIPDIIKFSNDNFGALPQLTIGRKHTHDFELLTALTEEEYYNTWKVFNSDMFEMRMKLYMMHGDNCKAGKKSYSLNLANGNIRRCIFDEKVSNVYEDEIKGEFECVGDSCPLNYCYNCHVYATMGIVGELQEYSYMTIRDRITKKGEHWIKEDMRRFLHTKL